MTRDEAIGSVSIRDDGTHTGSGLVGAFMNAAVAIAPQLDSAPGPLRAQGKRMALPAMQKTALHMYSEIEKQFSAISRKAGGR